MTSVTTQILAQLAALSPLLLVYLLGMVLALVYWGRYPKTSTLCLIGMMLLLVVTSAQPILTSYLIQRRVNSGAGFDDLGLVLGLTAVVGNLIRALAMGILLTAIFAGRRQAGGAPLLTGPRLSERAPMRSAGPGITDQLPEQGPSSNG